MSDFEATFTAVMTVITRTLRRAVPSVHGTGVQGDTGAVSIEHVLWYAAAAISVAVVATIIWNQVKTTASTPVQGPSAP
ncbi:MAG: hypothetical protein QNM02_17630 [Acidimicrobiia bacterium]|nr:hypothetical protein [Acidimicrobiia bacterium]